MKENYLIQPQYQMPRAKNDAIQESVMDKWQYIEKNPNLHGNINMILRYDTENKTFLFLDDKAKWLKEEYIFFGQVISSALLMYRLYCTGFRPSINYDELYKTVWCVGLEHKTTQNIVAVGEYKAAAHLSALFTEKDQMPQEFHDDLIELLNFLISDNVVHPYDYTIAGSVA